MKTNKQMLIKTQDHFKILEETGARLKVLYWFFAYPKKEISLSDLAKNTGISKSNANKIVLGLVEEGFLEKEILGKVWRISCNLDHQYNTTVKIPFNLGIIYQSGIIEYINQLHPNHKSIILFGSYRKGDDTEKSDVDIAIEIVSNENSKITDIGKINKLGYRENVKVNLLVFSRNKIDLNLFSNIVNGIVLSGFLEART